MASGKRKSSNTLDEYFSVDGQIINVSSAKEFVPKIFAELQNTRASFLICTLNLDHLVKMRANSAFRTIYRSARLVSADGLPLIWLARTKGYQLHLATGSDLVDPLCAEAAATGCPVYFIGANDRTLTNAKGALLKKYETLKIAGMAAPSKPFDPHSEAATAIAYDIQKSGAKLCLVGLGAPLQETFSDYAAGFTQGVGFIGVGASLEFIGGLQIRAPSWIRAMGIEWFWRLLADPKRMWRRYLACALLLADLLIHNNYGQAAELSANDTRY